MPVNQLLHQQGAHGRHWALECVCHNACSKHTLHVELCTKAAMTRERLPLHRGPIMYVRTYVCLYPVSAGWKVGLFSTGTGESPTTESLQLLNPTLIVHTYIHTYIRTHVLHYSTPHTTMHNRVTTHPHTRPHCRQTTDKGPTTSLHCPQSWVQTGDLMADNTICTPSSTILKQKTLLLPNDLAKALSLHY